MALAPNTLFTLPELTPVLREELALLPAHAARQPAGRALIVQPHAGSLPVDVRHLAATRLHADEDMLRGDVACVSRALPFEDEAFQLVLAQHAGDALPGDNGLIEELARVMAPGGALLWFGFNPWSPWLAWIHWRSRGGRAPQPVHADALRRRLMHLRLATVGVDYLGTCWPRAVAPTMATPSRYSQLLAPLRGAYLVTARKQRAVLTPLRPRARKNMMLGSRLAGTPSQRACA